MTLKRRMTEFVTGERLQFLPKMELHPFEIDSVNKIKIQIYIEHRNNWQDGDRRSANRSKFILTLREHLLDLGITYKRLPEVVQLVENSASEQVLKSVKT